MNATPVQSADDIDPRYRGTPVEKLLLAHNLAMPVRSERAELIIVTCMDYRIGLRLAGIQAFQVRTAGATPMPVLSNIAYARAIAQIDCICVIGHTQCAMCNVGETREVFAQSLVVNEGWAPEAANELADHLTEECGIDEPGEATVYYAEWLRESMPSCLVAPLLFDVDDQSIAQLVWGDPAEMPAI